MENQGDFTIDPINFAGLSAFVDEQRSQGLRYVPILDPAIPSQRDNYATYERGLQADAYIRASDGNVLLGNVSNNSITFFFFSYFYIFCYMRNNKILNDFKIIILLYFIRSGLQNPWHFQISSALARTVGGKMKFVVSMKLLNLMDYGL
jgi:hypothetical protein